MQNRYRVSKHAKGGGRPAPRGTVRSHTDKNVTINDLDVEPLASRYPSTRLLVRADFTAIEHDKTAVLGLLEAEKDGRAYQVLLVLPQSQQADWWVHLPGLGTLLFCLNPMFDYVVVGHVAGEHPAHLEMLGALRPFQLRPPLQPKEEVALPMGGYAIRDTRTLKLVAEFRILPLQRWAIVNLAWDAWSPDLDPRMFGPSYYSVRNPLLELTDGQAVRTSIQYVRRLASLSETPRSSVFLARHSNFPGRPIVVKVQRQSRGPISGLTTASLRWRCETEAYNILSKKMGPQVSSLSCLIGPAPEAKGATDLSSRQGPDC